MILRLLRELFDIILASPDPEAAIERAKVAAATEALNEAADASLRAIP